VRQRRRRERCRGRMPAADIAATRGGDRNAAVGGGSRRAHRAPSSSANTARDYHLIVRCGRLTRRRSFVATSAVLGARPKLDVRPNVLAIILLLALLASGILFNAYSLQSDVVQSGMPVKTVLPLL